MSESMLMWVEIIFDIGYLITIWWMVVIMGRRRGAVSGDRLREADLFRWGFILLALGDTGHVGFRVLAYAMGGLEKTFSFLGMRCSPVGIGSLATAVTVTLLYVAMAEAWRVRTRTVSRIVPIIAVCVTLIRFGIMIPAGNGWGDPVIPYGWSLARNAPLVVLGLLLMFVCFRSGYGPNGDRFLRNLAIWMTISYLCYAPVILLYNQFPLVGMLMMPKTLAYLAMAALVLREYYPRAGKS